MPGTVWRPICTVLVYGCLQDYKDIWYLLANWSWSRPLMYIVRTIATLKNDQMISQAHHWLAISLITSGNWPIRNTVESKMQSSTLKVKFTYKQVVNIFSMWEINIFPSQSQYISTSCWGNCGEHNIYGCTRQIVEGNINCRLVNVPQWAAVDRPVRWDMCIIRTYVKHHNKMYFMLAMFILKYWAKKLVKFKENSN